MRRSCVCVPACVRYERACFGACAWQLTIYEIAGNEIRII